ncbi:MAG: DUF5020 domain-containing protein [Pseudomonadota bacterium]
MESKFLHKTVFATLRFLLVIALLITRKLIVLGVFFVTVLSPANARFIEFDATNVQLLRWLDSAGGNGDRTVISIEHANIWSHGDFFGFGDMTINDSGDISVYGEISPRLSLSRTFGAHLKAGPFEDFYVAGTLEFANDNTRYLIGGGTLLKPFGFDFINLNAYVRDNPLQAGQTYHVTLAWRRVFELSNSSILFEGFADLAGREGDLASNQITGPRLLFDVGKALSLKKNVVYAGFEAQYWRNKAGSSDINEFVPKVLFYINL